MKILLGVIIGLASTLVLALPQVETDAITEEPSKETKEVQNEAMERCNEVMAKNGLNFSSFWHGAAHGLHSLSLEEIRHYFEPDAPEENKIPVVNTNLSAEQTILFNAPLRGYDKDLQTMALKVMAYFMLHDKPDFFEQGLNTLEKLTHQYHMHEIYTAAAPIYKKMKEDPPTDQELCPCVNDVTANGILTELVYIAKQLKYFARQPRSLGCRLGYRCRRRRNAVNTTEIIAQYEEEYLADSSIENAAKLLNVSPWKPNTLVGPEQWISYEAMLTYSMLDEKELNDFTVFMYCKLNQPDLDHARDLFN